MNYVIIGAGAAGINAAGTIRCLDPTGNITVISADNRVYSRCMLHHMISGKRDADGISFIDRDFFTSNHINWIKGRNVIDIDTACQEIVLSGDERVSYDKLLIAAGSHATIPPIKGLEGAVNVFTLRNIEDAEEIISAAEKAKKAVVMGAGLVGLDAASALIEKGIQVTVVEIADKVLSMQLDGYAAKRYKEVFENAGAVILTGMSIKEGVKDADGAVRSVILSNGDSIDCDFLVVAAGVRPNIGFIHSGIQTDRGIHVDDMMKTTSPNVYAAGDVTALSAIWPNAVKQSIVAAYNMTGHEKRYGDYFTAKNSINLLGLDTVSIGIPQAPDDSYSVSILACNGVYKKIIYKDDLVYGVILQGDISYSGFWTYIIKEKIKINTDTEHIFNLSFADFFGIEENGSYVYQ